MGFKNNTCENNAWIFSRIPPPPALRTEGKVLDKVTTQIKHDQWDEIEALNPGPQKLQGQEYQYNSHWAVTMGCAPCTGHSKKKLMGYLISMPLQSYMAGHTEQQLEMPVS